ncbi:DUF4435 domain-containing protein [Pseudomonas sp. CFBP 5750]
MALFNGADAIVFLEGGPSISGEELDLGKYNTHTCDIRFWQALFSHYRPGRAYVFKSIGSKTAVRTIAEKIVAGSVNNTVAVMDRDFERIIGTALNHPNVLYTYGYSWENDCWSSYSAYEAYVSITGACRVASQVIKSDMDNLFDQFSKDIGRSVSLDGVLIQTSSSLFDRENPDKYISLSTSKRPSVNRAQLIKTIKEKRQALTRPVMRRHAFTIKPLEDCFGHLYECFAFRALAYFLHRASGVSKPSKDFALAVTVDSFIRSFQMVFPQMGSHYDRAFSAMQF